MLFDLLNFGILLAGLFVIITSNQVHALFCLISVFIQITILLLSYYGLEFIPFIIVIVYIGAIAILFLFVVMMLDVNVPSSFSSISSYLPTSIFFSFISYFSIAYGFDSFFAHFAGFSFIVDPDTRLLNPNPLLDRHMGSLTNHPFFSTFTSTLEWQNLVAIDTDLQAISKVLYTKYCVPFLLSSFILLVAMIGAIGLTLKQKVYVKRQLILNQNHRDFEQTIRRITSTKKLV